MIVALDIRRVRDFGTGTYTRNLVENLARLDSETRYLLAGAEEDAAILGLLPDNFQFLILHHPGQGPWRDFDFALRLQRERVDLLHTPFPAAPWVVPSCRHIITVHDTVQFRQTNGGSLLDTVKFHRIRNSLHRAASLLSVSEATASDLVKLFGLPPAKIHVVYNAVDKRQQEQPDDTEIERTLSRHSAHGPYLLYVGNAQPHKNLARLIEAFSLVKDELRDHSSYRDLKLIIIGDDLSEHPELRHAVIKSRCQAEVRFLGYLPPQQLGVFYTRAVAFVFPSLHEGFGLPPLEAMAHGAPVLASNVSSLPEVLGDAALLVNPGKVFDISRGIKHLLLDEDLRATLTRRGRRQVAKFSWEESVKQILEVYRATAH